MPLLYYQLVIQERRKRGTRSIVARANGVELIIAGNGGLWWMVEQR